MLPALVLAAALAAPPPLDPSTAERFARLALACVHQEYPNKIAHTLSGDADVKPPRELTPAFYGCYDWHSAVHGHWLLARLARLAPAAPFAAEARAALGRSLTEENLAAELRYLHGRGRTASSAPTAWPGCCSWRPSCASGRTTTPGAGRGPWRPWSRPARRAWPSGCPS